MGYEPDKPSTLPLSQLISQNMMGLSNLGAPYVPVPSSLMAGNSQILQNSSSVFPTAVENEDTVVQVGGRGMNYYKQDKKGKEYPPPQRKESKDSSSYQSTSSNFPPPQVSQITVYNVPKEDLTIDKLNSHFKQFGSIVNIQVSLLFEEMSKKKLILPFN